MEYQDIMEDGMPVEEECFILKSDIIALQAENQDLRNQVHQLKYAKDQLELFILSMEQSLNDEDSKKQTTKKPRKVSEYQKAFQDFYKNNKNNSELIEPLKSRLCSIGVINESDKIPWYIVRLECKKLFDEQQNTNNVA
jgi:predicted RNase H-like nuclease (RuvC/YqgF family)